MESGVSPLLRPYLSLLILFTLNGEEEKGFIEKMKQDVEEVNTLMVEEQEILSYHVFKFSAEKKELICF